MMFRINNYGMRTKMESLNPQDANSSYRGGASDERWGLMLEPTRIYETVRVATNPANNNLRPHHDEGNDLEVLAHQDRPERMKTGFVKTVRRDDGFVCAWVASSGGRNNELCVDNMLNQK